MYRAGILQEVLRAVVDATDSFGPDDTKSLVGQFYYTSNPGDLATSNWTLVNSATSIPVKNFNLSLSTETVDILDVIWAVVQKYIKESNLGDLTGNTRPLSWGENTNIQDISAYVIGILNGISDIIVLAAKQIYKNDTLT